MYVRDDIKESIVVTALKQTSDSYPNQYEGKCSDGDSIYIHAKYSLSAHKFKGDDFLRREKSDCDDELFEIDLPEHLKSWHNLTIPELIDFCKECNLPIEFKLWVSAINPNYFKKELESLVSVINSATEEFLKISAVERDERLKLAKLSITVKLYKLKSMEEHLTLISHWIELYEQNKLI